MIRSCLLRRLETLHTFIDYNKWYIVLCMYVIEEYKYESKNR